MRRPSGSIKAALPAFLLVLVATAHAENSSSGQEGLLVRVAPIPAIDGKNSPDLALGIVNESGGWIEARDGASGELFWLTPLPTFRNLEPANHILLQSAPDASSDGINDVLVVFRQDRFATTLVPAQDITYFSAGYGIIDGASGVPLWWRLIDDAVSTTVGINVAVVEDTSGPTKIVELRRQHVPLQGAVATESATMRDGQTGKILREWEAIVRFAAPESLVSSKSVITATFESPGSFKLESRPLSDGSTWVSTGLGLAVDRMVSAKDCGDEDRLLTIGARNGILEVREFSAQSGRQLWRYSALADTAAFLPGLPCGTVGIGIVLGGQGSIYTLDPNTGHLIARRVLGESRFLNSLLGDNPSILVASATGHESWTVPGLETTWSSTKSLDFAISNLTLSPDARPDYLGGTVVPGPSDLNLQLFGFNSDSGKLIWQRQYASVVSFDVTHVGDIDVDGLSDVTVLLQKTESDGALRSELQLLGGSNTTMWTKLVATLPPT